MSCRNYQHIGNQRLAIAIRDMPSFVLLLGPDDGGTDMLDRPLVEKRLEIGQNVIAEHASAWKDGSIFTICIRIVRDCTGLIDPSGKMLEIVGRMLMRAAGTLIR